MHWFWEFLSIWTILLVRKDCKLVYFVRIKSNKICKLDVWNADLLFVVCPYGWDLIGEECFYFSETTDTKNISEAAVHCESFKPAARFCIFLIRRLDLFFVWLFSVLSQMTQINFKSIPRNACILRDKWKDLSVESQLPTCPQMYGLHCEQVRPVHELVWGPKWTRLNRSGGLAWARKGSGLG